jgi:mono/diheme cytochrome c family protein
MSYLRNLYKIVGALAFAAALARAQEVPRPTGGVVDFLAPVLANPVLQHSKEVYVLYGCAYCHGVDLKVRNGEAADLLHSALVGADINANIIGPLLRNGIPQTAKLSPMPQFSDLSDREIADIARWIHYSRQQEHYKELAQAKNPPPGDVASGKSYFEKTCASCHTQSEAAAISRKYDDSKLQDRVLRPAILDTTPSFKVEQLQDTKATTARERHGSLLENYSAKDVADIVAYLRRIR